MTKRLYNTPFAALLPGSISTDATIKAAARSLDGVLHSLALSVPNLLLYSRLLLTAGRKTEFRLLPALDRLIHARGGLKPLSTAELELLAWQFHVDFREVAKTNQQLASMILQSIPWHRIKGTPASIKRALALFGYGIYSPTGTAASRAAERAMSKTGTTLPDAAMPAIASAPQNAGPSGIIIEEDGVGKYWATYQLGLPNIADTATVQHIVKICNEMAPARCRLWRIYTDAFDRRPIIWSGGTRHDRWSDGWWTMHSGVAVPEFPGSDEDILVSFGVRNAYAAEQAYPNPLCGSFGSTIHLGFLAPYVDRPIWSRSAWSDVFPRNHGFAMSSLFSILWADRATTGRRWRGEWDARCWLDYTGFDRKLPLWRMGQRALSRAQNVYSGGNTLSDINACYSRPTAVILDAPPVWGASRWSADGNKVHLLVIDERFNDVLGSAPLPVNPGIPRTAGASLLAVTATVPDPHRVQHARHDESVMLMRQREASPPGEAISLAFGAQSLPVIPSPTPPTAVTHYRAPLWSGAWCDAGRTWSTETNLSVQ